MANLQPFRATYYNPAQVPDLGTVLTPPYDVISPIQQAAYYARDPHNFIRLDLRRMPPGQSPYTEVATELKQWLSQGVLTELPSPAFYFHRHVFDFAQQRLARVSLVGLCELVPFAEGVIFPHEKTMDAPKQDRLQLMQATQAHLSPVWSLYRDPENVLAAIFTQVVQANEPLLHFGDEQGGEHQLWACTDLAILSHIQEWFQSRSLYIADGHHRYESSLGLSLQGPDAARFGLMYLSNTHDPGLKVLPTHRLLTHQVTVPAWPVLLQQLSQEFQVTEVPRAQLVARMEQAGQQGQTAFGVLSATQACLVTASKGMGDLTLTGRSEAYHHLDVAVLHEKILYRQLAFPAEKVKDTQYIRYTPDVAQIEQWLQENIGQVALLLNATSVDELCAVADARDTMPPKSTYFYPKIPSGMLLYRFENFS